MVRAREAALLATSTVRAFGGALPPTMPSADFCVAVRSPYDDFSPVTGTQRRPPEVRSTAFAARPPDLPPRSLMTLDFAIICPLVRPGRPLYPVLVHRAAALLYASFGPRLATTPLRFANPSPPSGWIEDSHLQAVDHARHTKNRGRGKPGRDEHLLYSTHSQGSGCTPSTLSRPAGEGQAALRVALVMPSFSGSAASVATFCAREASSLSAPTWSRIACVHARWRARRSRRRS